MTNHRHNYVAQLELLDIFRCHFHNQIFMVLLVSKLIILFLIFVLWIFWYLIYDVVNQVSLFFPNSKVSY